MEIITISSIPENICTVESFIDRVKEQIKLSDDLYGNILIAVTEAVNNAIQHGNQNDSSKNVVISFSPRDDSIMFRIEDEGSGFDYHSLPDPTAPENIEKIQGRGAFLMKKLADELVFLHGGKVVEITFYINL